MKKLENVPADSVLVTVRVTFEMAFSRHRTLALREALAAALAPFGFQAGRPLKGSAARMFDGFEFKVEPRELDKAFWFLRGWEAAKVMPMNWETV